MWRLTEDVSGDFLFESKNVHDSFFIRDGRDLRHCFILSGEVRDCRDLSLFGIHVELAYESAVCGLDAVNIRFCYSCWGGADDLLYCWLCGSNHCFGCVGLRKKQYCILNKQYTKEEYEELVPRIIEHMSRRGEWGEFFPSHMSVISYNHSLAQRYFPLSKEKVQERGRTWYEKEDVDARGAVAAESLPDGLPAHDEAIVSRSTLSGRPFKITTQEIKRYRQLRVPLPRLAYDERIGERAGILGGIRLYERKCVKTGKPILTTYSPDSPYTIWHRDEYEKMFSS